MSNTAASKPKVTTAAGWSKAKRHYPLLPSGERVALEVPDLPQLIASGKLPNSLVDVAIKIAQGDKTVTREAIEQQPEFYKFLIQQAVKEPEVTDDLYAEIPYEDKELIVALATRQTDLDAEYMSLGGLETSERWRKFRGLTDLDEDVEDVSGG